MESTPTLKEIVQKIQSFMNNLVSNKVNVGILDKEGKVFFYDPNLKDYLNFVTTYTKENFKILTVGDHSIPISGHNIVFFKATDDTMVVLQNDGGPHGQLLAFKGRMYKFGELLESIDLTPVSVLEEVKKSLVKKVPVFLVKIDFQKKKFPMDIANILYLIDGKNSVIEIVEKTKLPRVKVNEILRKYQKKKWLKIRSVIEKPTHGERSKKLPKRKVVKKAEIPKAEEVELVVAAPEQTTSPVQSTPSPNLPPIDATRSRSFLDLEKAIRREKPMGAKPATEIFFPKGPSTEPREAPKPFTGSVPFSPPINPTIEPPSVSPESEVVQEPSISYEPQQMYIFPIQLDGYESKRLSERESKLLMLCDGRNTIEDLSEHFGEDRLSLIKELRKIQKKKLLRFMRVLPEDVEELRIEKDTSAEEALEVLASIQGPEVEEYIPPALDEPETVSPAASLNVEELETTAQSAPLPIEYSDTLKELSELVDVELTSDEYVFSEVEESYEETIEELGGLLSQTEQDLDLKNHGLLAAEDDNAEELIANILKTAENYLKEPDDEKGT